MGYTPPPPPTPLCLFTVNSSPTAIPLGPHNKAAPLGVSKGRETIGSGRGGAAAINEVLSSDGGGNPVDGVVFFHPQ